MTPGRVPSSGFTPNHRGFPRPRAAKVDLLTKNQRAEAPDARRAAVFPQFVRAITPPSAANGARLRKPFRLGATSGRIFPVWPNARTCSEWFSLVVKESGSGR